MHKQNRAEGMPDLCAGDFSEDIVCIICLQVFKKYSF